METHLVNSQMLSRKDVRVWFWEGSTEYAGPVKAIADNGLLFHVHVEGKSDLAAVKKALAGRQYKVELSSPKVKAETKVELRELATVSAVKGVISVIATFLQPLDPKFVRLLLEPSVTHIPKKT